MSNSVRELNCIVVSCYTVRCYLILSAEFKEALNPLCILNSADSRSADLEALIISLDRIECLLEELAVFSHISLIPETRKIRLIPYLDRPLENLITVTSAEMLQECNYHICPKLVVLWRSCISLPVKYCLCSACHLIRHESELEIRTDIKLDILIENSVEISVVILYLLNSVFFIFMINSYIITEKSMTSDIFEAYLILNKLKLTQILFCECQSETSRSYTIVNIVVERNAVSHINFDFFVHVYSPFCISLRSIISVHYI